MAQNNLPKTVAEMLDLGEHCQGGLFALGEELGILQYTPDVYGPLVTGLRTAHPEADERSDGGVCGVAGGGDVPGEVSGGGSWMFDVGCSMFDVEPPAGPVEFRTRLHKREAPAAG